MKGAIHGHENRRDPSPGTRRRARPERSGFDAGTSGGNATLGARRSAGLLCCTGGAASRQVDSRRPLGARVRGDHSPAACGADCEAAIPRSENAGANRNAAQTARRSDAATTQGSAGRCGAGASRRRDCRESPALIRHATFEQRRNAREWLGNEATAAPAQPGSALRPVRPAWIQSSKWGAS